MTFDELLLDLDEKYDRIAGELDAAESAPRADRERLRAEIVGLFRETESALGRLGEFKERIRALVDRYKQLPSSQPAAAAPAVPTVSDHLGSSTYVERGWSAIAAGDASRAVKELERALELAPNDPQAESLMGWAQMLREQYDEALFTYYKVLMRDPNNPLARVNLGYICLKKGIFGEAIEHLSKAIRQDDDRKASLYANLYMGLVYLEREMFDDARSFLHRTLELGPNMIQAWWEIGRAFYLEGNHPGAADAWRRGMETNRFNLWGERCGQALKAVEAGEPVSFGA